MTPDKLKRGKQLLAALNARIKSKPSILGRYTPPIYDAYYGRARNSSASWKPSKCTTKDWLGG